MVRQGRFIRPSGFQSHPGPNCLVFMDSIHCPTLGPPGFAKAVVGAQRLNPPFECIRALKKVGRKSVPPSARGAPGPPNFHPIFFVHWRLRGSAAAHRPEKADLPRGCAKTQEDPMRYNNEEIEIMNEYETLRTEESDLLDLVDMKRLSLAERNALEFSLEFVNEEMGSLREEYYSVVTGRGR